MREPHQAATLARPAPFRAQCLAAEALAMLRDGDAAGALATLTASDAGRSARAWDALGMVQLALGDPDAARAAFRTAIAAGADSAVIRLNLALAEAGAGERDTARALLHALIAEQPTWIEPRLRLAADLRAAGERAPAIAAFETVLELDPANPTALLASGVLRLQDGQPEAAVATLLRLCARQGASWEAWDALGMALLASDNAVSAGEAFREAQDRAPERLDIALRRAEAALAADRADAELERLAAEASARPLDPGPLIVRATLLSALQREPEALELLEAAVELAPDLAEAWVAFANTLTRIDRGPDAAAALAKALTLLPGNRQLRETLAAVLVGCMRYVAASNLIEEIVEEHGETVPLLCNLCLALGYLGRQDRGVAAARRALTLDPNSNHAQRTLVSAIPYLDGVGGDEILEVARNWARSMKRGPRPVFANDPDPERVIRLGLLSSSLQRHPVGWLTVAGFEHLPRDAFDIVCIGTELPDDLIQPRFRRLASQWHVPKGDPVRIAEQVRDLGIDVLIDLGGHGHKGMLPACASRAAPVQIKWVGMQSHSTGLAEMDWFITDRWETPDGYERFYSERLLRLPDGYVCYSPPWYAPDVTVSPAERNGRVTFGCFNNLGKVTPRSIELWSSVLCGVNGSRLVIKSQQLGDQAVQDYFLSAFAAHGVLPDRLEFRGGSAHRELLAAYGDIDVVLDPLPYTGGLTTCEALWMGVPTITLPGESFASRHATSHLSNVGLTDWVASDEADYVNRAIHHCADPVRLAALRSGLRAQVKASPLCDAPRFGRNLGSALRFAWRDWCGSPGRADAATDRS